MYRFDQVFRRSRAAAVVAAAVLLPALCPSQAHAQGPRTAIAQHDLSGAYGPYSGYFVADGRGLAKSIEATDPTVKADAPWTLSCMG